MLDQEICQENAQKMLRSKSEYFKGWVGDIRFYMVDGDLWHWAFGQDCGRYEDDDAILTVKRLLNHFCGCTFDVR